MSTDTEEPRNEPFITPTAAAELLNTNYYVLAVWRSRRTHALKFYKIGRKVYYKKSDVLAYIESCADLGTGPRDYEPLSGVRKSRSTKRGAR